MQRGLALHLVVQAVLAGAASLLVLRPLVVSHAWNLPRLDAMLLAGALGHLAFLLVEGLKGGPVSESVQAYTQWVGFFLIVTLMALVTFNDIWRNFQ